MKVNAAKLLPKPNVVTAIMVRIGPLPSGRPLRHGLAALALPRTPQELSEHNLLAFNLRCQNETWPFLDGSGASLQVAPQGDTYVSWCWRAWDRDAFRVSTCSADMQQGNLMAVLQDYNPRDRGRVHAVFAGPGQQVPARVRVILDYLLEHVQLGDD